MVIHTVDHVGIHILHGRERSQAMADDFCVPVVNQMAMTYTQFICLTILRRFAVQTLPISLQDSLIFPGIGTYCVINLFLRISRTSKSRIASDCGVVATSPS